MARVTKVVRTKTEKESDAATESAFVVNECLFMLFAKSISIVSSFQNIRSTFRTNKLFRLVLEFLLHFFVI